LAKKKQKFNKIVEITWKDAEEIGHTGWNDLEDAIQASKTPCPIIKSVGYVIFEDSEHISILSSISDHICGTLEKIPMSFVVEIREL
jgi:hypothetical protein